MNKKIKKMYIQDYSTILAFVSLFLIFLMIVIKNVYMIAPDNATKTIIILSGVIISAFAVASSIAVIVHIKKNKESIYSSEI